LRKLHERPVVPLHLIAPRPSAACRPPTRRAGDVTLSCAPMLTQNASER
jgi:hypothetical protein